MKNDVKILTIKEVKPLGRGGQVRIEFKQKEKNHMKLQLKMQKISGKEWK